MIRDSSKFDMLFLRAVNGVLVLCFFFFLAPVSTANDGKEGEIRHAEAPELVRGLGVPRRPELAHDVARRLRLDESRFADLVDACVEIKFRSPHAIDATDNLTYWLISTQVDAARLGDQAVREQRAARDGAAHDKARVRRPDRVREGAPDRRAQDDAAVETGHHGRDGGRARQRCGYVARRHLDRRHQSRDTYARQRSGRGEAHRAICQRDRGKAA